jgi:hypothetical protein
MEEPKKNETKPCCCGALLGALVIVFAWWEVSWAAIALTVLGAILVIKEFMNCCCCRKDKVCKS